MSKLTETLAAARQIALYHLRVNPTNVKQGRGSLLDQKTGDRCALGLIAEAFNIPVKSSEFPDSDDGRAYNAIAEKLGIHKYKIDFIYRANDSHHMTFEEIADMLERKFESGEWDEGVG